MGKKLPNSRQTVSAGNITVSQAIADKLADAAKTEAMLALNKEFRTARTQAKRARLADNKFYAQKHKTPKAKTSDGESLKLKNLSKRITPWQSDIPMGTVKAGYNQWSFGWNQEAHTGVTGKPPKKIPRSDARYQAQPYVPKMATARK